MLLRKRPRPPIRRTTSMNGINVDPSVFEPPEPPSDLENPIINLHETAVGEGPLPPNMNFVPNGGYDQAFLAMVSPRSTHIRTNSGTDPFMETAHFLHTCGLCKRRLAPGRDIYMYRGDTAFCSLECREQQMKQDEMKEKKEKYCTGASKKEGRHASPSTKASSKSETVAAA
ncbi:hypothetical protein I3843_03G135500 [Carya illinoinensis]|uniref:FLZ-type domain-containing protein n=2 Tax=Carya illinoinensis TaxID=32201 RepID=A0A922FKJ8_CARIL|nr:FCS-Like Zinc finger 5-like [Carya illinoinensis]KAG6721922.1 hypothetical protein I3842_03G135900 [Carya illinoinensis]KAG7987468.1 hypothetical protein I3843_03G135500 [Carya illinoinensis]